MLVGISAVVIGVCALVVSLYETSLMREEQRAAVMPILELARSYNASAEDPANNRLWIVAQNVGIGPARVKDFMVTVDGEPHLTWDSAMRALAGRDERIDHSQSVINGRTIPPDQRIRMYELAEVDLIFEILRNYERLDYTACYCSIFDECWTTSYSTFGISEPIDSCPGSEHSFTE